MLIVTEHAKAFTTSPASFTHNLPTGAAQRSGAKSGAKRFDLLAYRSIRAWLKPSSALHFKSFFSLLPETHPLNSPNIPFLIDSQLTAFPKQNFSSSMAASDVAR